MIQKNSAVLRLCPYSSDRCPRAGVRAMGQFRKAISTPAHRRHEGVLRTGEGRAQWRYLFLYALPLRHPYRVG